MVVRILIAVILSVALLTVSVVSAQQRPVSIRYLGWAFFLVTAADGLRIAIDPYGNIGYPFPTVEADVVLVTHDHTLSLTREQLPATTQVVVMEW
jgi:L-ascorbate metabolism protein UlaG (beta-lactamase superfamily)